MIKNQNEDLDAEVLHLALGTLDVQLMVADYCLRQTTGCRDYAWRSTVRPEDAAATAVRCEKHRRLEGRERERERGREKMIEGEGDATPSQMHARPRREETPTHVRAVHTAGTQ